MLKDLLLGLLNTTVGAYFENIDASQLSLSVLSGNIQLYDLVLKSNIGDMLGLPVRVLAGRCASLTMKVPWTSLYSHPVEVDLRDLYLLLTPNSSWDAAQSDEKARRRIKHQILEGVEAAQRELTSSAEVTESGYFEKLGTQILKNLQVRIQGIHIRYEFSSDLEPSRSFAIGIALSKFAVLTTDKDWTPAFINDSSFTIFKLLDLESFILYWDCNTQMISRMEVDAKEYINKLRDMLMSLKFENVVGPISIISKLQFTPNPDKGPNPFSLPMISLDTVVQQVSIGISNLQFQDMLRWISSWQYLYHREQYRQFRPAVKSYRGNYRLWWKFAINCVLEDSRRNRNVFSWRITRDHRQLCRAYYKAMYKRQIFRQTTAQVLSEVEDLEDGLDILNILIVRKLVDICQARLEAKATAAMRNRGWGEWLAGFVFSAAVAAGTGAEVSATALAPRREIRQEMVFIQTATLTRAEKSSFYLAIGDMIPESKVWQAMERAPRNYVAVKIKFVLQKLDVVITQDKRRWNTRKSMFEGRSRTILHALIKQGQLVLGTRPYRNGISVEFDLESINVYGGQAPEDDVEDDYIPHIIGPRKERGALFHVTYERFPLNSDFEQRLLVHGQPLDITYDYSTVRRLIKCFTLPSEHVAELALESIRSQAAITYYNTLKTKSSITFKKIVEATGKIEVDIRLEAPCFILPQPQLTTINPPTLNVMVVELGELVITSQLLQAHSDTKELKRTDYSK